jgi:hypothetical protein
MGSAEVMATGGTEPFQYKWDDWTSQTTPIAKDLCAAQYTVLVIDSNGCTDTSVAFITGPENLTITVDSIADITCHGLCDGNAVITASGGVGEYNFIWNDSLLAMFNIAGVILNDYFMDPQFLEIKNSSSNSRVP